MTVVRRPDTAKAARLAGRTRRMASSRSVAGIAVAALVAIAASAATVYAVASRAGVPDAETRRTAVRTAIQEMRPLLRSAQDVDPRLVRMLAQGAGIDSLGFQRDMSSDAGNGRVEAQPVMDTQGRIVGFLTWRNDDLLAWPPATAFAPAFGLIGAGVLSYGALTLARLRKQRRRADGDHDADESDNDDLSHSPQAFRRALTAAIDNRELRQAVAFAVVDLEDLGEVQNQFGALRADETVEAIVTKLRETLPDEVRVGRRSNDRLVMLMVGVNDPMSLMQEAMRLIAQPHWIDGVIRIGAHAGFAQAPRDAIGADELARAATQALRVAAKKDAGAIVAYDRSLNAMTEEQQFIRRELPRALAANELELHYQPIVTADGGQVVGVEALLRWTHATRGAIPPASFIPVAEQMGLIGSLGEFVLRRALSDASRWPNFYIAVNLSPMQVRDGSIVRIVDEALTRSNVPPPRLVLEITEGVLIDNPDDMLKRISDLRALGICIALDDFGSGYSNLTYLQRFPIDKLKVDRAFVTSLGKTANAGVIIQAIIALGRALGLKVVVEGVETEEQRVLLRMAGCDEMQGFLFSRPVSARVIDQMVAKMESRTPMESRAQGGPASTLLTVNG